MADNDGRERIGTALRALTAELVAEKQRVAVLRRENRELRAELEALRGVATDAVASEAVVGDGSEQSVVG
jgi:hypothetical protein